MRVLHRTVSTNRPVIRDPTLSSHRVSKLTKLHWNLLERQENLLRLRRRPQKSQVKHLNKCKIRQSSLLASWSRKITNRPSPNSPKTPTLNPRSQHLGLWTLLTQSNLQLFGSPIILLPSKREEDRERNNFKLMMLKITFDRIMTSRFHSNELKRATRLRPTK